jgi:glycine oxidase
MRSPDAIVVGGGVVGASVAYHLAEEGLSVTLFERADLASEASGAAAGMLAPICESTGEGPFFELATRSLELFPELAPRLRDLSGMDPQYCRSGVLKVALSSHEAEHLRGQAERLSGWGLEWLEPAAARQREPHVTSQLHGALWSPREGHVYSPQMTRAYAHAASALGATLKLGTPVVGLLRAGDRVTGVRTADGEYQATHVVLCGGVWTRFCAEWIGAELPLEPVRGQILALDTPQPPLKSIVWSEEIYLVPKLNGTVIAGATEEHAGFDCRTTATAISKLLGAAVRAVPELEHCPFRHAWAGLRPDTPDHLPAIGPWPGVDGLSVAAGHYRNGVLLSPITGRLIAGALTQSRIPDWAAAFRPDRLLGETRATS